MEISYDKGNDILSAHKGFSRDEKFKGNIEIGDLVLDLSTRMRIRGIEIMNASNYLSEFIKPLHSSRILESLTDMRFSASIKGESLTISLTMIFKENERREEIPAKIAVPIGNPIVYHD